ncbi:MAG: alanine racemase [Bacillota bacterium]|nr:alanine racemase [Bacillota bacterium]
MKDLQKRTWAEVSLNNIEHNYRTIRAHIPENTKFLGIVKADAYGHGAVEVAKRLEKCGADYLAIACLDEAIELRKCGVTMPILILGHTPPDYVNLLLENKLTQTVSCEAKAIEYSNAARELGGTLKIHIKLDTGMSRLGYLCADSYFDEGVKNVVSTCNLPNLDVEGVYTHFAVSDFSDEDSIAYTKKQFKLFTDVIRAAEEKGVSFKIRHCANSGAVVNHPEMMLDMVRPGFLLYGYGDEGKLGLKPAMRMVSTVSTIKYYEPQTCISYGRNFVTEKRTRMGVMAAGYADGLPWAAAGKYSFAVEGKSAPQRGNICMDMCMIDLTDIPDASVGSEVEIFGENARIERLAEAAGTIPYELLCAVSKRVPRVYID